jgi:hypothetical protein
MDDWKHPQKDIADYGEGDAGAKTVAVIKDWFVSRN